MISNNLTLEIQTLRYGQTGPYSDSEYEFIIRIDEDDLHFKVEDFCTKVLFPCKSKLTKDTAWYEGYYVFTRIEKDTFRYYVNLPFLE